MSKRPGRHRVREFAQAVDGSSSSNTSEGKLAALANALRNMPLRSPDGPRTAVKHHVINTAARNRRTDEPRSMWTDFVSHLRLKRNLASATVMCTALLTLAGIGFGASNSLPGETLYDMKRRSESVQLAFLTSDEERGKKNLQLADHRLNEVRRLVGHKADWPTESASTEGSRADRVEDLINRTLTSMDSSTANGAKALRQAYNETGKVTPLTYLGDFVKKQKKSLSKLVPKLPSSSQEHANRSLAYVGELGDETAVLLGGNCDQHETCSDDPTDQAASPTTPSENGTSASGSSSSSATSRHPSNGTSSGTTPGSPTDSDSSSSGDTPTGSDSDSSSSDSESSSDHTRTPTPSDSGSSSPPSPTGVPSSPSQSKTENQTDSGGSSSDDSGDRTTTRSTDDSDGSDGSGDRRTSEPSESQTTWADSSRYPDSEQSDSDQSDPDEGDSEQTSEPEPTSTP